MYQQRFKKSLILQGQNLCDEIITQQKALLEEHNVLYPKDLEELYILYQQEFQERPSTSDTMLPSIRAPTSKVRIGFKQPSFVIVCLSLTYLCCLVPHKFCILMYRFDKQSYFYTPCSQVSMCNTRSVPSLKVSGAPMLSLQV